MGPTLRCRTKRISSFSRGALMFRALVIHCVTNDDNDHTITVLACDSRCRQWSHSARSSFDGERERNAFPCEKSCASTRCVLDARRSNRARVYLAIGSEALIFASSRANVPDVGMIRARTRTCGRTVDDTESRESKGQFTPAVQDRRLGRETRRGLSAANIRNEYPAEVGSRRYRRVTNSHRLDAHSRDDS